MADPSGMARKWLCKARNNGTVEESVYETDTPPTGPECEELLEEIFVDGIKEKEEEEDQPDGIPIYILPSVGGEGEDDGSNEGEQLPHEYQVTRTLAHCSADKAFNMLKAPGMSAPFAPAAQEGFTPQIILAGGNPISQYVNSIDRVIVNTTLPGHTFHSGTVTIQVTPTSDTGSTLQITGVGVGSNPNINNLVGLLFFGSVANNLAATCNGYQYVW